VALAVAECAIDEAYWAVRRAEQDARGALFVAFHSSRRAVKGKATAGHFAIFTGGPTP
jgi:hypothetical protein